MTGKLRRWATQHRLLLLAIVLIGLFVRVYGIAYGLPYFYGPPEIESLRTNFEVISPYGNDEIQFVRAVTNMLASRSLNPDYFAQPGTPTMYVLMLLYGGILAFGLLSGAIPNIEAVGSILTNDPEAFYLAGRLLVALLAVAGIPLLYSIGARLYNRRAGLVAALIFALSPLHAYLSRIIRGDVLMILCLLAAFWFCLEIIDKGNWKGYLGAGFFTGLAVVGKYPAVTFAAAILLAYAFSHIRRDFRKLAASSVASLAGAFIGSPYAFLDFPAVLAAVQAESSIHLGGASEGIVGDTVWYLKTVLPNAIAWVGIVLLVVGIAEAVARRRRGSLLALAFAVIFLSFIVTLGIRWERWIVPIIPFVALLAGGGLDYLAQQVGRLRQPAATLVVILLAAGITLPLAQLSLLAGYMLTQPETRTLARDWMLEHIPEGSRILVERHGPQPPKLYYAYYEVRDDGSIEAVDIAERPFRNLYGLGQMGWVTDLENIRQQGIEYLLMSDYYQQYLNEGQLYPAMVQKYEQLRSMGEIIYEIGPRAGAFAGPSVTIVRISSS